MNPTQAVLEERIAALEGGTAALAVASGHAAQLLVFHTIMSPGDNFIAANRLYGGSINQFGQTFKRLGIDVTFVDMTDPDNVADGDPAQHPRGVLRNAWPTPRTASTTTRPSPTSPTKRACRSSATTR
jgi:cystathionine beta-lyase/cystathionine gamma-synthase